jgi:hypothetical protein
MSEQVAVIRDRDARRVARERPVERDGEVFGRPHLVGSVDLGSLGANAEWGPQGARIQDVALSIDSASAAVCEAAVQHIRKKLTKERDITSAQVGALERKIDDANARSSLIEAECAGLRSELVELRRAVQSLSAGQARRATQAAHKPKAAPKPNGKSPAAGSLPDFIIKAAKPSAGEVPAK